MLLNVKLSHRATASFVHFTCATFLLVIQDHWQQHQRPLEDVPGCCLASTRWSNQHDPVSHHHLVVQLPYLLHLLGPVLEPQVPHRHRDGFLQEHNYRDDLRVKMAVCVCYFVYIIPSQ